MLRLHKQCNQLPSPPIIIIVRPLTFCLTYALLRIASTLSGAIKGRLRWTSCISTLSSTYSCLLPPPPLLIFPPTLYLQSFLAPIPFLPPTSLSSSSSLHSLTYSASYRLYPNFLTPLHQHPRSSSSSSVLLIPSPFSPPIVRLVFADRLGQGR